MVRLAAQSGSWPIIGHAHQVERLRRMVIADQYPLAILMTGAPHVGRMTLAQQFAAASLCPSSVDGVPCGDCRTCRLVAAGRHPDVETWDLRRQEGESGASKSNSLTIETVRKVASSTALRPYEGARRFIIIDEAETLGEPAQQALLKTLEDLPGYATIILIATTAGAMLDTVRSRSAEIALQLVSTTEIEEALDNPEAESIAALAGGRPGWAVTAIADEDWRAKQAEGAETLEAWICMTKGDRLVEAYQRGDRFLRERRQVLGDLQQLQMMWRDMVLTSSELPQFAFNPGRAEKLIQRSTADMSDWHRALVATQQCIRDLTGNIRPRLAMQAMVNQWPTLS
jgi:DNA polymerase III subunit delta'